MPSYYAAMENPGPPSLRLARLPSIPTTELRRSFLFMLGIGTPILAAIVFDELPLALPAAMTGMLLSFADDAGAYGSRVRAVAIALCGLVLGVSLGLVTRGWPPAFWICVVGGAFAVGFAAMQGRLVILGARDAAVGFVVGASLPAPALNEGIFMLIGLAVILLARSVDSLVCGPLPLLQAGRVLDKPNTRASRLRFAVSYGIAVAAAFRLGEALDPVHAPWIVTTTIVVMQPDARASYLRIFERIAGTMAGVAATWLSLFLAHSEIAITVLILLLAANIPHHVQRRYWLHTGLIAWAVLLIYALSPDGAPQFRDLLEERLLDMLIGCALALLGTAGAFIPFRPSHGRTQGSG
jgi:uncharacterized membrane protein YccC